MVEGILDRVMKLLINGKCLHLVFVCLFCGRGVLGLCDRIINKGQVCAFFCLFVSLFV